LRTLHDQIRLTRSLGSSTSPRGVPLDSLIGQSRRQGTALHAMISRVPRKQLDLADSRALSLLASQLATAERELTSGAAPSPDPTDCDDPFPERLRHAGLDSLTARTFACYGAAARRIVVGPDTLDRLSILGLLGRTDDPDRRRRLFLALMPVWRSVN